MTPTIRERVAAAMRCLRGDIPTWRRLLESRRKGTTTKIKFVRPEQGDSSWFLTEGFYPDGALGEVFLSTARTGDFIRDLTSDAAICASFALQYGCPPDVIVNALSRIKPTVDNPKGAATPLSAVFDLHASMIERKDIA